MVNAEARLAALEAIKDTHWARLDSQLQTVQIEVSSIAKEVAALSAVIKITLNTQDQDLRDLKSTVGKLPARGLAAGGILIGAWLGLSQLFGMIKT